MAQRREAGLPGMACFFTKNNYPAKMLFCGSAKIGLAHISTLHFPAIALLSPA